MNKLVVVLLFTGVLNVLIGTLVFLRNPKSRQHLFFLLFSVSTGLWITSNAVYKQLSLQWAYYDALVSYAFALLLSVFLSLFLKSIAGTLNDKLVKRYVFIGSILTVASAIPGILATGVTENYTIKTTQFAPLYGVALVGFMASGIIDLIKYRLKASVVDKQRTGTILLGFLLAVVVGVSFNLLLPILTGSYSFVELGPLGAFFVVAAAGYSIVKHKLFDMKLVVARSFGYLILIFSAALAYVAILFPVISLISDRTNLSNSQQSLIYGTFSLVLALSFQSLRRYLNRLTSKIFYRDAYESQAVLDQVSGVIVGNVDPHKVQSGSLKALSEALQPTYIGFLLMGGNSDLHHGDQIGQHWVVKDPSFFHSRLQKSGKKITIYDELEEASGELREVLRAEDISVVAPLVTKDETIGYLVLGRKKSGNIYNSQDIGLLNIASNELAVALQNAQRFEEIQAFNITLQEKVNEATRELKKTNRKLVALDEAKDEFISMASHQLRTPLTSIKGYLSMLAEGDLGKVTKAQEKAIKEAFGSSQRMVYLIADFLNVSRIKTGKFVIEPKEVDLPMVVSEEITQLREMAGSRDITLQYQAPEVFPKVMLDDNKIRQVMMNIVDNAIYYTAAGGTVTIQLFVDSADVVFKVIDTGIGVPKREQHKLFTKFFRAGNARKARPDGTGLGLFMAQKIIAEQGGSIIFESTEGKGSTFGFRFPLSKIKT